MAAIGAIRKHGVLLMCIIGIALLAFLVGDFTNLAGTFSDKNTIVSVNGKKMDDDYRALYDQNTALWKIMYDKSSLEESETFQVHEMTFAQIVEDQLLDEELEKLGLSYTDEMIENATAELVASIRSQQPNQFLYKLFSVISEMSNAETALNFINNVEDYKDQEQVRDLYNAFKAIERMNLSNLKRQSYFSIAQSSEYFSDLLVKKMAKDNKTAMVTLATIDPNAQVFGNIIPTVTPKEIKEWYKNHKNRYLINENSRDIDIAIFPINPSNEDLQNIEDSVKSSYSRFLLAPSIEAYNIDQLLGPVDSTYYQKKDIALEPLDSLIFERPVGSVIEPFNYESRMWYFGKVYGSSLRPDSVQVAYLVVDYKTEQNAGSKRSKEQAKTEADSLKQILESSPNAIFSLLPNYLGGRNASDSTLWVVEKSTYRGLYDSLILAYNQKNTYLQENQGAYIIFQPIAQTKLIEKRLFVIYPTEIKASDATISQIRSSANQLVAESTSPEKFLETANKNGIQVLKGTGVTSMTATIQELQNCRDIVTWAYNDETKLGDISDVIKIDNRLFAVANLRNIKEKGIAEYDMVKDEIEAELIAKKKLQIVEETITKEMEKGSTIEQLANKYGAAVRDSVPLSYGLDLYQNAQVENSAIGKLFTLQADQKLHLLSGKFYLYLVKINSIEESKPSQGLVYERMIVKNMVTGRTRNEMTILEDLKNKADILDNRVYFYQK